MPGRIISIHSYRGGTGKSNMTANIAGCMIDAGRRVAVIDSDVTSPGVHMLFGIETEQIQLSLLDSLWNKCTIDEAAYNVTRRIAAGNGNGAAGEGACWLVPASMSTRDITRVIDEGYDLNRLGRHFDELIDTLELDYLLIDTHPGISKETMLSTAISDVLVVILRPDQQDYQGTAVVLEVARKLEVPRIFLLTNKVLGSLDQADLKSRIEKAYGLPVIGMTMLSEDLAGVESRGLFIRRFPDHELTHEIRGVAERIMQG